MGLVWPLACQDVPNLSCLSTVFLNGANAYLLFGGVVATFLIVWGGIRFITSGGDAKQVTAARQLITYAIIGLIVVLSSYSIIFFIGFLTNTTNCITNLSTLTTGCK